MKRDFFNCIDVAGVKTTTTTDTTAVTSAVVDTQGYEGVTFLFVIGAATDTDDDSDATFTPSLAESDAVDGAALDGGTTVAADDMLGTVADATWTSAAGVGYPAAGDVKKLGYIGGKRYVQATLTPASHDDSATITIMAILGHPHQAPTANPPA